MARGRVKKNQFKVQTNDALAADIRAAAKLKAEFLGLPEKEYGAGTLIRELVEPQIPDVLAQLREWKQTGVLPERRRVAPAGAAS